MTQARKHRGMRSQKVLADYYVGHGWHEKLFPESPTLPQRVAEACEVRDDGCWQWLYRLGHKGYGQIRVGDKRPVAHRVVWQLVHGPIPEGMVLDHLCRNRACVNPEHLEPVTPQENTLRGEGLAAKFASRTHCNHGHEWTPENTYHRKGGGRECRACNLERQRKRRAA